MSFGNPSKLALTLSEYAGLQERTNAWTLQSFTFSEEMIEAAKRIGMVLFSKYQFERNLNAALDLLDRASEARQRILDLGRLDFDNKVSVALAGC